MPAKLMNELPRFEMVWPTQNRQKSPLSLGIGEGGSATLVDIKSSLAPVIVSDAVLSRQEDIHHHACRSPHRSISSASSAVRGTMLETWMYSRGLWSSPPIGARPSSTGRPILAK
jgi:hypothetical protein